MKGLIFTEFLEFVEQTSSYDMVDQILLKSHPPSGGCYTSIGTYKTEELIQLVDTLSAEKGLPASEILKTFGEHLFRVFTIKFSQFINKQTTVFNFLSQIETHIHVEVKKYYPEANLPHFQFNLESPEKLIMVYQSDRPLADMAEGLIIGCICYYQENITLAREDIPVKTGYKSKFILTKSGSL